MSKMVRVATVYPNSMSHFAASEQGLDYLLRPGKIQMDFDSLRVLLECIRQENSTYNGC